MLLLQSRKRVKILTRLSVSCNQHPQRWNTAIHLSNLKISAYMLITCSWPELMFRITVIINQRWKVHNKLACIVSSVNLTHHEWSLRDRLFFICVGPQFEMAESLSGLLRQLTHLAVGVGWRSMALGRHRWLFVSTGWRCVWLLLLWVCRASSHRTRLSWGMTTWLDRNKDFTELFTE